MMTRLGKNLGQSWKTQEKVELKKCVAGYSVLGG